MLQSYCFLKLFYEKSTAITSVLSEKKLNKVSLSFCVLLWLLGRNTVASPLFDKTNNELKLALSLEKTFKIFLLTI
jgi:hypothetical protein